MAVKSSGQLSITTDIVGEFGGSAPHAISEYKRGGSLVPDGPAANSDIPTTNSDIQFSDFYGAVSQQTVTLTSSTLINGQSNRKQITASSFISTGDILVVPSNFWVWSDSTSVAALVIDIPCTVQNYGKIIGKGGQGGDNGGDGLAGGPAIKINTGVTGVTVTNYSGAYIAGGGGGGGGGYFYGGGPAGGGGAGGGAGGTSGTDATGGSGGVLNSSGGTGTGYSWASGGTGASVATDLGGNGGGAGGEGGYRNEDGARMGGGGGGRVLSGSGGTGGFAYDGGSGGNAGTSWNGTNVPDSFYGAGGGGWGAAGGNGRGTTGGAAGKAVDDSGVSYTLTDNGTIYGAT